MQGAAKPGADQAGAPNASTAAPDVRELHERRDHQLVRRLQAGDRRAFEALVRAYQNRVYALSLRMVGNPQEAEDLAQDVFITVHRKIGSFRGDGKFSTWLFRIASNTCKNRIKYLRGRHFDRRVPVDEAPAVPQGDAGPVLALQSRVHGPEAMAEGVRLEAVVQRELAALEPDHRLLIVLRDVQGLSYQEILSVTGLQPGTLKSRLHRARLALKARLEEHLR